MFSVVKYKSIDYAFEATARRKLTLSLLILPMPYNINTQENYPHSGSLPDDAFRKPWIRGNTIPSSKLNMNGLIMEELKSKTLPMDSVEKISTFAHEAEPMEVVPSSNPASQTYPEAEEAFWLVTQRRSEADLSLVDDFVKATGKSLGLGHEGLLLEEFLGSSPLRQFRKHMPTLQAKLSRLKAVLVLDPLQTPVGGPLSELMIFGKCVHYDISLCGDINTSQMGASVKEEFSKEPLRESFMLHEVESCSMIKESHTSLAYISNTLQVRQEPEGHQMSSAEMLKKVTPAGLQEMQHFRADDTPGNSLDPLAPLDPKLPVPLRLYSELELDVPLSPAHDPRQLELRLPDSHLQPERLPPIYKHWLVSDEERDELEQVLWSAEKQHNAIAGFFLAEPPRLKHFVQSQLLLDAHQLLGISAIKQEGGLSGLPEELQALVKGCSEFPEKMTAEPVRVKARDLVKSDDFTMLSGSDIDDILRGASGDAGKSLFPEISAKLTQPPSTPVQGDVQQLAVPSQQEDGKTVKKLIIERMAGPSEISNTAQDCSSLRAPQTMPAMIDERVDNFNAVRQPQKQLSNSASGSKPPTQFDLLTSFMALRQQHSVLETSEKTSATQTDLQTKRFTSQKPPEQKLAENGQSKVKGMGSSSGPLERSSSTVVQGTQILASTGQTIGQTSKSNIPVGQASRANTPVDQASRPNTLKAPDNKDGNSMAQESRTDNNNNHNNNNSKVIPVQATESQLLALQEVKVLGDPCYSRALEMGLTATGGCKDFTSLDTERSHFLLRQQQRQLSILPGLEQLYVEVTLLHTLVTVKELLLHCGLSRACDYLAKAKSAHDTDVLEQLHKKYLILQFHSQRNQEPDPKLLELQDVMRSWLQSVSTQQPLSKVLLLISANSDSVRTQLIGSLNEISGEGVVDAVLCEENCQYVDDKRVLNSLRHSSWVVVCSLHLGPDFPWHAFSLVVEYDSLGLSPWPSICSERNIRHVTFATITPASVIDSTASSSLSTPLEKIPFTLFVTEGLLDRSSLLQTLESEYNLTMIERSHSPSLKMLGGAHQYAVITVDESTAVLLQEVDELAVERASERVAMRLIALSLQYSCCWFLLHLPSTSYSCLSLHILNNLALIYSAVVLFGMKSEEFTVKVLVVSEEEDIARWIYQIAHRSMMSSDGDPQSYLDREWLSVVPSQDEGCLVRFPCVNPLVAQIMLRRAPSLHWLLGASLTELQQLLPEVPHKVIKLFTDTTGLYSLGSPSPQSDPVPDPGPQVFPKPKPQPRVPQTGQPSLQDPWATATQHPLQTDASFYKKGNWGQTGSSPAAQNDAFFHRTQDWGQVENSSAGESDVVFTRKEDRRQTGAGVFQRNRKWEQTGRASGAQTYACFHRKDDWRQAGNSSVGPTDAFSLQTEDFERTGNISADQTDDSSSQWKEYWRDSANVSACQSDAIFYKKNDCGQAGNSSAGQTDAFFIRKDDWGQRGADATDALFQLEVDWGQAKNSDIGQTDMYFHRKNDWEQSGNSSTVPSSGVFERKDGWGTGQNFGNSSFSPTPAATATPPAPQGLQHKSWHMDVREDRLIPRMKQGRDWTSKISPKESAYLMGGMQASTSPFQRSLSSGRQSSTYFPSQMPTPVPCGPAHSIASSPVSRWTSKLISEAHRFSSGAIVPVDASRTEQDRKRRAAMSPLESSASSETAGFLHTKKGKLLYEKVPGRSDGQTRLRFF